MPLERARIPLAFCCLGLIWGTTPLSIKVGLNGGWEPLWFCALRMLLASAVLLPLVLSLRPRRPLGRAGWRAVWPIGVFGMAVNFGITVWGQQYVEASLASLLGATQPITTAVIVLVLQRQPPSLRLAAGLLAGLVGTFLLFPSAGIGDRLAFAGALAVLAGVTLYSGVYVYIHHRIRAHDLVRVVAAQNLIGGVLVAAAAAVTEGTPDLPGTPSAWSSYGYVTLISSIVALLLSNWLIPRMGATRFSTLSFVTPLVGVGASMVVLGEHVGPSVAAGGALIACALLAVLVPTADAAAVPVPTPAAPSVDLPPVDRAQASNQPSSPWSQG